MSANYNASQVGVPYVRVSRIVIGYPDSSGGLPSATLTQSMAVKMADGSTLHIGDMPSITTEFDLVANGMNPIPVVDQTTGAPTGATTSLDNAFGEILAVVRSIQNAAGQ